VPARVSSLNNAPTAASGDTRACQHTLLGMLRHNAKWTPLSPSLNGGCFTSPRWPNSREGQCVGWWACPHAQPLPSLVGCHQRAPLVATGCREAAPSSPCSTDAQVDSAVLPAPTFTLVSGAARRQCRVHVALSSFYLAAASASFAAFTSVWKVAQASHPGWPGAHLQSSPHVHRSPAAHLYCVGVVVVVLLPQQPPPPSIASSACQALHRHFVTPRGVVEGTSMPPGRAKVKEPGFGPPLEPEPRQQQDWILMCL
jgi:hypothetical protein